MGWPSAQLAVPKTDGAVMFACLDRRRTNPAVHSNSASAQVAARTKCPLVVAGQSFSCPGNGVPNTATLFCFHSDSHVVSVLLTCCLDNNSEHLLRRRPPTSRTTEKTSNSAYSDIQKNQAVFPYKKGQLFSPLGIRRLTQVNNQH